MLLSIQNLKAGYDASEILHDVSLEVGAGEFVALIGPNGAGKSTVLKAVMGLCDVTGGKIQFQDEDMTRLPTSSRLEEGIGFVPQGRLVFPTLSVKENLEMGGYLLDNKETLVANLENVYKRFPALRGKMSQQAGTLSGGQQQQLAIGRALMMSPKLLMLDEPSLGLSPKLMQEVFATLDEIRASGTAILVVEQNVRLALAHADRGYLLAGGTIRESGTAKKLCDEELMQKAYLA